MLIRDKTPYLIACLCLFSFALTAIYAHYVLQEFPNSADEYAYVFQADTLRAGRLWNPIHPLQEFFGFNHIAQKQGKWVGRFPPGWPMVLAAANVVGIPYWLVNPLLSALAAFFLYRLSREIAGEKVALITTASVAFSPFFVFNGASFFSHTATLVFVLLYYYHGILFINKKRIFHALLSGLWIGCAFLARPFTAVLASIPLILWFLFLLPWRSYWKGLLFLIGASPALLTFLIYNDLITGDPLLPVTTWKDGREGLGFIRDHTVHRGIRHTVRHLRDFPSWASVSILLLFLPAMWFELRSSKKWAIMLCLVFISLMIGYVFYWGLGGNRYGPRFYFEAYPFAVLGVTAVVFGTAIDLRARKVLQVVYLLGFASALLSFKPHTITEHRVVESRTRLYQLVESEGIENAVVFVASRTGGKRFMIVGDLLRNDVDRTNSVLYVRELGPQKNRSLMAHYPDREFYRYSRESGGVTGALEQLEKPARKKHSGRPARKP